MNKPFARVLLHSTEAHPDVALNVLLVPNVPLQWHVSIKDVSIHVQACAGRTRTVEFAITARFVFATAATQEIPSSVATSFHVITLKRSIEPTFF